MKPSLPQEEWYGTFFIRRRRQTVVANIRVIAVKSVIAETVVAAERTVVTQKQSFGTLEFDRKPSSQADVPKPGHQLAVVNKSDHEAQNRRSSTKMECKDSNEHHRDPPRRSINIRLRRNGRHQSGRTYHNNQFAIVHDPRLVASPFDTPNQKCLQLNLKLFCLNPDLRIMVKKNRSHVKCRIFEFQTRFCSTPMFFCSTPVSFRPGSIQPRYRINW